MPSEEAYQAVLAELGKLHEAWRIHRDSMNRAVGILGHDYYEIKGQIETLQRWQWARFGLEIGIAIVVLWGVFIRQG